MFSGVEVSSNSQYFYTGVRQNLSGYIDQSGWIYGISYGKGKYHYSNSTVPGGRVDATFKILDAAIGYQHRRETGALAVLIGLHGEEHLLSAFDPGNQVQGESYGISGQIDLWMKPKPNLFITLYGSANSVFGGYYGRVFAGYKVPLLGNAFLGPELALMGNKTYWETRLGVQIHSLQIRRWGLSASLGMSRNLDGNSSAYGSLAIWRPINYGRFLKVGKL